MLVLEAMGNLGADAIIKDLNGQKYIAFSVAHTESYKDSQGQRKERTTWISCLRYGESQVINYLKKNPCIYSRRTFCKGIRSWRGITSWYKLPG